MSSIIHGPDKEVASTYILKDISPWNDISEIHAIVN